MKLTITLNTATRRKLKVVFIQISPHEVVIKTAYQPNKQVEKIYRRLNKSS